MKSPVHMTWRLEEELYEKILAEAENQGLSVSAFVRNVIRAALVKSETRCEKTDN